MTKKRLALLVLCLFLIISSLVSLEWRSYGASLDGTASDWGQVVYQGMREIEGWQGNRALTLAPFARNPFFSDSHSFEGKLDPQNIDLLLIASPEGIKNPARNYILGGEKRISSRYPARGDASIVLRREALRLTAKEGALWSAGQNWGNFTIDFRLRPSTIQDGDVFFSWSGVAASGLVQSVEARVENRRLLWEFTNFFRYGTEKKLSLKLRSSALIPEMWRHHRLRFKADASPTGSSGASPGLLEYLLDDVLVDAVHATPDGHEGYPIFTPKIGSLSSEDLLIAPSFVGYLDELLFTTTFIRRPPAGKYAGPIAHALGRGRTEIIDTEYPASSLRGFRAWIDQPGDTKIQFYALAKAQHPREINIGLPRFSDPDWHALDMTAEPKNPSSYGQWYRWKPLKAIQGRYLAIGYILSPDPADDLAPKIAALELQYEPRVPPFPPRNLMINRNEEDEVQLTWSRRGEEKIAGWWLSWGLRPSNDVARNNTDKRSGLVWIPWQISTDGLSLRDLLPISEDRQLLYLSLRAAWAEGAPNKEGKAPLSYRALSKPSEEISLRP